jgi:hypothetical protein
VALGGSPGQTSLGRCRCRCCGHPLISFPAPASLPFPEPRESSKTARRARVLDSSGGATLARIRVPFLMRVESLIRVPDILKASTPSQQILARLIPPDVPPLNYWRGRQSSSSPHAGVCQSYLVWIIQSPLSTCAAGSRAARHVLLSLTRLGQMCILPSAPRMHAAPLFLSIWARHHTILTHLA